MKTKKNNYWVWAFKVFWMKILTTAQALGIGMLSKQCSGTRLRRRVPKKTG